MLKSFIFSLFQCKKDKTYGYCQEKPKERLNFIYFNKNDKEKIEYFLGERYDFDFTDAGVIVWDEESLQKIGIIRSFYFPYNVYIMRDVDDRFFYVNKYDFEDKYEII